MNTIPAFKNPFGDFDFGKFAGEFKFPMLNVESLMEANRKNIAALQAANQAAVESLKSVTERQVEMVRQAMEEFSKVGFDVMSAATVEEKAAKQIDFAKKSYETALANVREISDLVAKGHADAVQVLSQRAGEIGEELKASIKK